MRKYQDTWELLKKEGRVHIENVVRENHDTVIQMLRKESLLDTGFRYKCAEEDKSYTIGVTQIGDLLILILDYHDSLPDRFIVSPEKIKKKQQAQAKNTQRAISNEERERLLKDE